MTNNPPRIYIDQNMWIALSRQFYGQDPTNRYKSALDALTAASDADAVRVPLSFVHLVEVCTSGDMERRKRLAVVMLKISKHYALAPITSVRNAEIMEAVVSRLGVKIQWFKRELLVQKGLWCAVGLNPSFEGGEPEQQEILKNHLMSDEFAVKMLSEWMSSNAGREHRQKAEQEAELFDKIRHSQLDQLGRDRKRHAETMEILEKIILPIAESECLKVGIDPAKLYSTFVNEEDKIEFAGSIPSCDVLLSLILARDEEKQRDIDRNDLLDMGFLSTAIPYCDLVVTEKYFGNLAVKLKLGEKYKCTILTDLTSLPSYLPH